LACGNWGSREPTGILTGAFLMATWAELSAQLGPVGFRAVCWVEASCGEHGDFRGALEPEPESESVFCPKCDRPIEAAVLGRGLIRQIEIGWECVSPPTPAAAKRAERPTIAQRDRHPHDPERQDHFYERARREVRQLGDVSETISPGIRRRATRAEMEQRIQVVAQKLAAGECHHAIALSVFPHALEPETHLRILLSRRRRDIQQQVSQLRA
jgi:hypothetical protein